MSDQVRVLRVLEYVGEWEEVQTAVARSIHGERVVNEKLTIKAATVGVYPDILAMEKEDD